MVIHVDFTRTFDFLEVDAGVMARIRAAAWQGWSMHTAWVFMAISIHVLSPHLLPDLALFSFATLRIGVDDQYAHIVYVGFHVWRSFIGRICLFSPFASDADIDSMSRLMFWISFLVVVCGGSLAGNASSTTLLREAVFFILMLGSIAPGLWFIGLHRKKSLQGDDAIVEYRGRLRGEGYSHRDTPERFRPLGKDVLELGDAANVDSAS